MAAFVALSAVLEWNKACTNARSEGEYMNTTGTDARDNLSISTTESGADSASPREDGESAENTNKKRKSAADSANEPVPTRPPPTGPRSRPPGEPPGKPAG